MSSETNSPIRVRAVGTGGLVAVLALIVLAFWWEQRRVRELDPGPSRIEGWAEPIRLAGQLERRLARIYRVAHEPATPLGGRAARFFDATKAFSQDLAAWKAAVEISAPEEERGELINAIERVSEAGEALSVEIESLLARPPGRDDPETRHQIRQVEESYSSAVAILSDLSAKLGDLQRAHAKDLSRSIQSHLRTDLTVQVFTILGLGIAVFAVFGMLRRRTWALEENNRLLANLRASEAKYRSIFDNAVEGIFQATPEGRFITANKALAKMYGYPSPKALIEGISDLGTQLSAGTTQREALLAELQARDSVSNFNIEVIRPDGRVVWLRENVRAVRDGCGRILYLEGTVEDVTDWWWSEQRRELEDATEEVLARAATVAEARPKILECVCRILEWQLGAVWDVDREQGVLACGEIWHHPDVDVDEFELANAGAVTPRGQGLAGEVWESGQPKWLSDIGRLNGYSNVSIAARVGMGSAFCVPIPVAGGVEHVLEFYSRKTALPNVDLLGTLSAIGLQLGHLIERKNAEDALRKSEMRKAAILQSAMDCVISFDAGRKIIEFNPAAERTFGYAASEVIGRDMVELIIPKSMRAVQRRRLSLYNADALNTVPAGRRFELVAMRRDGSEFPVEAAITRIVIGGKPLFTAYLRDITARKEAERVTSELAAVVANSNDAIIACTLEGVVRSWNAGAERIYGFSAKEMIGTSIQSLFPPDRQDEFSQMLNAVQKGLSLANYESLRLRKDGRRINVSLTDSPIRGEHGAITGVSSIARDITERKRLEEQLLQSQKMDAIGRLAGGIAHDFNNILTAILGYSDLLIGQIEERHWMYKHLNEIRKAADFAASLTQQLLAFSRRQPLFLRVFQLNDTVKNLEKMLRRLLGENITIRTDLLAQQDRLKADPGQIEQVLLNLCVNARDAMPTGGTLTIATADITHEPGQTDGTDDMPAGDYVRLSVSDTGTGIPQEILQHIFEPFFTTKEVGQGTGLGLATCYGIVKQSGGYIAVDSKIRVGATFSIYLPRVNEAGEKTVTRIDPNNLPRGRETILYVEDEITVRSLTSHILRRLGYTVIEAGDGKQARDLVEAHNGKGIDLVFSDVVLPDLGGKELADWVCGRSEKTKRLFCSGYMDEMVLERHGLELDAEFLQKPFTPADLARKIREVIDGKN